VQNQFHIAKRDDAAVLDACAANGIAFIPFGPIGSGHTDLDDARVAKVAARHDATVSQIALAWLLALAPITLAIPGTGSVAHLEENVAAGSIALSPDDLADLGM
jgi:pyridoxine 4-dehydrogenase